MPPSTRAAQIADLHREFPSTVTVKETASELLLQVNHNIRISSSTEYGLSLYIKLLSTFPQTAPVATMPYTSKTVPITPPNISPSEVAAYQWDSQNSSLAEAVRNAFHNAADRWGPVAPPTMENVALQLSGETDRLLNDLVSNPNCLDAYCYQLPIVKQMREASRQTVSEVERVATENVKLRPVVEDLQADVRRLQTQLQQQVEALQKIGSTPLLTSVCTPEALVKTLESDVRTLNNECRSIGKAALAMYKTDKRGFQDQLEQYKAKSIQMHTLDMKARTFRAQTQ